MICGKQMVVCQEEKLNKMEWIKYLKTRKENRKMQCKIKVHVWENHKTWTTDNYIKHKEYYKQIN